MGKRREGREAAVQFLVYCDLNGRSPNPVAPPPPPPADDRELHPSLATAPPSEDPEADAFWALRPTPATKKVRDFALDLARGALAHRPEIDERIGRYAKNYEVHRIAAVDRNVLRLALYEMFYRNEIPPIVSINEGIEIAKRFGTEESGRFVNGILDRAKMDLTRPLRTAVESPPPAHHQGSNPAGATDRGNGQHGHQPLGLES